MIQNLAWVAIGVVAAAGLGALGWFGCIIWRLRTHGLPALPFGIANG